MKNSTVLFFLVLLSIQACKTTKKSKSPERPPTTTGVSAPNTRPFPLIAAEDGTRAPGSYELSAILFKYKDVTLEQLQEGHAIYTLGACKNCHGAANIHLYSAEQWEKLIEDMSQRAELTGSQKDAVLRYVLSIKATQTN